MKKITVLFLLIFAIATTHAQNYKINFVGTGAATSVDYVKVENLTQCTSINIIGSDTLHLVGTSGINGLNTSADNTLNIYPNPITGNCLVNFEATTQGKTNIKLYDISGKTILQIQELLSKGNQTYKLSGINSGIYFLRIESDKYSYTAKIVSYNTTFSNVEITHIGITHNTNNQSTEYINNLKTNKSLTEMPYTTGDRLKLTGFSGSVYRTIFMLVPTKTQTVSFNFVACTDADGNNYSVVQIGTQIWMGENLRTTKYNDNTQIPKVINNPAWSNLSTGAYCWANDDSTNSALKYGALYNWYAVDTGKLAPVGWHVPSDVEWVTLTSFLGGQTIAGGKLKENCSSSWQKPNIGATNESGFTALPGGYRYVYGGIYLSIGTEACFWTTHECAPTTGTYEDLTNVDINVISSCYYKNSGVSVRCVKN